MKRKLDSLKQEAKKHAALQRSFFKSIKKPQMRKLDDAVHSAHHKVFENTDCLNCGNCCRTLGPRITNKDIERIADALRQKPHEIVSRYLHVDEDNDYVFRSMPCPFLDDDNYCSIYTNRPAACREYPHSNRPKFLQITELSIKNCETCPALFQIIEQVRKEWK